MGKPKTIIITGSAGLIGSHLSHKFISLGFKVVGIDSLIGGYYSNMPTDTNFTYYELDIVTDHNKLAEVFKQHEPETVIHCAALAHEGLSVFSPKKIVENIYSGTAGVCSAAISAGTKVFINTSSMARYGNGVAPFKEHHTCTPVDPYGLAKKHAEEHLNLMHDIHGIKVFHMVPHNVCGPHQCYSDPFRNVMSIFANLVLQDKPVYVYGDGLQKRSFSHIDDCVDAYIRLYELKDTLSSGEVFNIGPDHGSEITIQDLANRVHIHFNKKPNINNTIAWITNSPARQFKHHLDLGIINENTPKTWTERLFNK